MRRLILIILLTCASAAFAQTASESFNLGVQRVDAGDFAGALAAFQKAEEQKFGQPFVLWERQARTLARLGRVDDAYAVLEKLTTNGFRNADALNAENDYLALRTDARWPKVIAAARKNGAVCASTPEYRAFDYWLGEWDVEANGKRIAASSVQLILGECDIFENYSAPPYFGKSFSHYDAATKKWRQYYVDSQGRGTLWEGGVVNGEIQMFAHNGPTLMRMTYIKEGADKVRQRIESSFDEGKSWSVGYDGLYTRRK